MAAEMTSAAREGIVRWMATPSATVWRRRVLLMFALGLLIAIPVTLLLRSSGSDDSADVATPSLERQLPLNPSVRDSGLGLSYQVPEGWRQHKASSVIQLRSPDRSVQIGVSTPGPASDSRQVLQAALADLRSSYKGVSVAAGSGKKLGGLEARGAVVAATMAKGTDLRILVAVAKGQRRTHLVEVFTGAGAPAERVAQAQRALDSLRFSN
jgi:hypothetical protein